MATIERLMILLQILLSVWSDLVMMKSTASLPSLPPPMQVHGGNAKGDDKDDDGFHKSLTESHIKVPLDHFFSGSTTPLANGGRSAVENPSFKLRYLYNTDYSSSSSPASTTGVTTYLLFIGGMHPITTYTEKYRLFIDLAQELSAAVVFVEMRYFGKSLPFGKHSDTSVEHLRYLSTRQVLADCIHLIRHLRSSSSHLLTSNTTTSVIAYGVEEGGLLSAWLRKLYPDEVQAAVASSAPMRMFAGSHLPLGAFHQAVSYAFKNAGCDIQRIHAGLAALVRMAKVEAGRRRLNQLFELAPESWLEAAPDAKWLMDYVEEALTHLPALHYPYPVVMDEDDGDRDEDGGRRWIGAKALETACAEIMNGKKKKGRKSPQPPLFESRESSVKGVGNDKDDDNGDGVDDDLIRDLYTLVNYYYKGTNATGDGTTAVVFADKLNCIRPDGCAKYSEEDNNSIKKAASNITVNKTFSHRPLSIALLYLTCRELQQASCAQGPPNDMFLPSAQVPQQPPCRSEAEFASAMEAKCGEIFESEQSASANAFADVDFVARDFGFPGESGGGSSHYSRVLFVQSLDPLSMGAPTESVPHNELYVLPVERAGRGQELLQPNTCDPANVVEARVRLVELVRCWAKRGNDKQQLYNNEELKESCNGLLVEKMVAATDVDATSDYVPPTNKERGGGLSSDSSQASSVDSSCRPIYGGYPWGRDDLLPQHHPHPHHLNPKTAPIAKGIGDGADDAATTKKISGSNAIGSRIPLKGKMNFNNDDDGGDGNNISSAKQEELHEGDDNDSLAAAAADNGGGGDERSVDSNGATLSPDAAIGETIQPSNGGAAAAGMGALCILQMLLLLPFSPMGSWVIKLVAFRFR